MFGLDLVSTIELLVGLTLFVLGCLFFAFALFVRERSYKCCIVELLRKRFASQRTMFFRIALISFVILVLLVAHLLLGR